MMDWFASLLAAFLSLFLNSGPVDPQVPCYFIFGDSLSDNGNNNNLQTTAKVNYPPYGIDFPPGPTGRFSNGKNIQDVIAERLGFPTPIPSFASANGDSILQGVNYASGAAGIRLESGQHLGDRTSLDLQLRNHVNIVSKIINMLGKDEAQYHLSECIYTVDIGNNDYINNYFLPQFYQTSHLYTPEQYAKLLIQQYAQQIQSLYGLGAKKVALFGLGAIGCTPHAVAVYGTLNGSLCVDEMNYAASLFTKELSNLVNELNKNYHDASFTLINLNNGFSLGPNIVTNSSCCQVAKGEELCVQNSVPCSDRSKYVFWDGQHTTEAINIMAADVAYATKSASNAYPFNIQNLAKQ